MRLFFIAAGLWVIAPSSAFAVAAPVFADTGGLTLVDERVSIACDELGFCRTTVEYRFRAATRISTTVDVSPTRGDVARVAWNGAAPRRIEVERYALVAEPGPVVLRVETENLVLFSPRRTDTEPQTAFRHPSLGDDDPGETSFAIAPIAPWIDRQVVLEVRVPDDVEVTYQGLAMSPRASTIEGHGELSLEFRRARTNLLLNGGVVLGIGGRLGEAELRLRFGYEVASFDWLMHALTLDTNFDDAFTFALVSSLAPRVERASWSLFGSATLPLGFAFGVGPALQKRSGDRARFGGRVQGSISFGAVSLVAYGDVYDRQRDRFEAGMLCELTL